MFLLQRALALLDDTDDGSNALSTESSSVGPVFGDASSGAQGLLARTGSYEAQGSLARTGSYRTYQSLVVAIAKLFWTQRIPLATVLGMERGRQLRSLTALVFDPDTSAQHG